jgi:hypothetical protein
MSTTTRRSRRGRNRQSRIWTIRMDDGTWAVACQWCRKPLGRGTQARALELAARHTCTTR